MARPLARRDGDFFAWTQEQAAALREAAAARINAPIDWNDLAEELEDMGRSEQAALASDLARIIEHLLKLEHSPARDPRSGWGDSVVEHRGRIEFRLADAHSLRGRLPEILGWAWRQGRRQAARGLARDGVPADALPAECPYRIDVLLDQDWWPENRHGHGRDPG